MDEHGGGPRGRADQPRVLPPSALVGAALGGWAAHGPARLVPISSTALPGEEPFLGRAQGWLTVVHRSCLFVGAIAFGEASGVTNRSKERSDVNVVMLPSRFSLSCRVPRL